MIRALAKPLQAPIEQYQEAFWIRCPVCFDAAALISNCDNALPDDSVRCRTCGAQFEKRNGIWRMLTPRQLLEFASFQRDYEFIRRKEGRGSLDPAYYLALPFADLTGNFVDQWRIRARSFRFIEKKLLANLSAVYGESIRILDLGGGNGWLSYRLALAGHRPVALDICDNPFDGLEAATYFASVLEEFFPRFHADMDELPFEDAQFDIAIFNAAFHYSTDYVRTMREVVRCLRPGGTILIVDSPSYCSAAAGEAMRTERALHFHAKFGARGHSLKSREYLTPNDLEELSTLGIKWTRHSLWYGLSWWLRPWIARLKGRREPSQFYLYEGRLEAQ